MASTKINRPRLMNKGGIEYFTPTQTGWKCLVRTTLPGDYPENECNAGNYC